METVSGTSAGGAAASAFVTAKAHLGPDTESHGAASSVRALKRELERRLHFGNHSGLRFVSGHASDVDSLNRHTGLDRGGRRLGERRRRGDQSTDEESGCGEPAHHGPNPIHRTG